MYVFATQNQHSNQHNLLLYIYIFSLLPAHLWGLFVIGALLSRVEGSIHFFVKSVSLLSRILLHPLVKDQRPPAHCQSLAYSAGDEEEFCISPAV